MDNIRRPLQPYIVQDEKVYAPEYISTCERKGDRRRQEWKKTVEGKLQLQHDLPINTILSLMKCYGRSQCIHDEAISLPIYTLPSLSIPWFEIFALQSEAASLGERDGLPLAPEGKTGGFKSI